MLKASEFQVVFDGHPIYVQGQQDSYVHYLIDGTVEFRWNDRCVQRLAAMSKAAHRALDKPGRKRHTVQAVSNCVILRIPCDDFNVQLEAANLLPGPQQMEVSELAAEKSSNWMIKMLQSDLFARLPALNIQKIFGRMERVKVDADEIVLKQGGPGDFYYVIERGYCEVSRQIKGDKEIHLADLGAGEAFGEAALIADKPRNASVTMLSDGTLMRLSRDDFNELIRQPLLQGVSARTAISQIEGGFEWLDIRHREECASTLLQRSHNVPFNILRLRANRLDKKKHYIVCCDDPRQSAVGALPRIIERGLSVVYLDVPLSAICAEHSSVLAPPETGPQTSTGQSAIADNDKITTIRTQHRPSLSEESKMDEHQPVRDRLENTIDKIDRLYSQKEWEAEKASRLPLVDYTHTVTGQRLADLIDEMDENREQLPQDEDLPDQQQSEPEPRVDEIFDGSPDVGPLSETQTSNVLLVDTQAPMAVAADDTLDGGLFDEGDGLSQIIQDFEYRLRDHIEAVTLKGMANVQDRYRDKLKRLRKAAAIEVRKRQELSRRRYEQQYKKKELQLRAHYKKLMALANKISEQKAQLQVAKQQFEEKLSAANAVYRQVEDMRKTLRQHIGELPPVAAAGGQHSA